MTGRLAGDGSPASSSGATYVARRRTESDVEADTAALVVRAREHDGNAESWNRLVERFTPLVWTVARSFGCNTADAAEITQITWLRLAENIDRIKYPERLGAWLVTTARRECIRHRRLRSRETTWGEPPPRHEAARAPSADLPVLLAERDDVLRRSFARLPERSRTLLVMLLSEPSMSYEEISRALGMPIGSIGPTRARILSQLRCDLERAAMSASD